MMPFTKELRLLLPSLAKEEGATRVPFATKMGPPAVRIQKRRLQES